jgi:hypothetical protein
MPHFERTLEFIPLQEPSLTTILIQLHQHVNDHFQAASHWQHQSIELLILVL